MRTKGAIPLDTEARILLVEEQVRAREEEKAALLATRDALLTQIAEEQGETAALCALRGLAALDGAQSAGMLEQ